MVALLIVVALVAVFVGVGALDGSLPLALLVAGVLVAAGTFAGWRTFRGVTGGRRLSDGL